MTQALYIPLAFLPVLAFLGLLVLLDSYKLVAPGVLLRSVLAGTLAALFCLLVNLWGLERWPGSLASYSRYAAPLLEETAKAAYVAWLIRRARTGFLVDAAIHGFAVGTGFAVAENAHYLRFVSSGDHWFWVVRGFGTAVMHGSTTAIFALLAQGFVERHGGRIRWLLPGLAVAVAIHSAFNHVLLPPLAETALLLTVFPLLMLGVFAQSERSTRRWLGLGFDADAALLEQLLSGGFRESAMGRYLQTLHDRFPPAVVGDMVCLLRIRTELAMRAKGILLAREAGVQVPVGEDVKPKLEELRYLERSIGRTGLLALHPFRPPGQRELWQVYALGA